MIVFEAAASQRKNSNAFGFSYKYETKGITIFYHFKNYLQTLISRLSAPKSEYMIYNAHR